MNSTLCEGQIFGKCAIETYVCIYKKNNGFYMYGCSPKPEPWYIAYIAFILMGIAFIIFLIAIGIISIRYMYIINKQEREIRADKL